jgi:drug/metabolite transporter (DMT)-like permease
MGININTAPELGLGAFFGFLAALFYGAFYLASQRGRQYLNTLSYFSISNGTASFFLFLYSLLLGYPLVGYNHRTWITFLIMGVVIQVLGWLSINFAQGHLSAAVVSPTMLGQPMLVAILAWLFLGERFTTGQIIGGVMIFIGVFVVHASKGENWNSVNRF